MPAVGSKRRVLAGSRSEQGVEAPQVVATATATRYPAFPTGPDANGRLVFAGDMRGAKIRGARWALSAFAGFTTADCRLQHSPNGVDWTDVVGATFTQASGVGVEQLYFDQANNDAGARYWAALIDMTGTPGTSSHIVELIFSQCHAKGHLAPPGQIDVNH